MVPRKEKSPTLLKKTELCLDLLCTPGGRVVILFCLVLLALWALKVGIQWGERLGTAAMVALILLLAKGPKNSMPGAFAEVVAAVLRKTGLR